MDLITASNAVLREKLSPDQYRCLVVLLLTYPLSVPFLYYSTNNRNTSTAKYIYSVACSILLSIYCFDFSDGIHLLTTPVVTYMMLHAMVHTNQRAGIYAIWVYVLGHLSYCHIYRQIYDYGSYKFDHTAPMMLMTLKLTSISWSVHDHYFSTHDTKLATPLPNALEFMAYVYFFPCLFVGPFIEFKTFQAFIQGTLFPRKVTKGIHRIVPVPILPALHTLAISMSFLLLTVLNKNVLKLTYQTLVASSTRDSFITKLFKLQLTGFCARFQYYGVWKLSEGACILCGLGYVPETGSWDRVPNVKIMDLEFSTNFKDFLGHWNLGTSFWLKHYVYLRLGKRGRTVLTYTVSAIWHGFYPGYYLTFLTGSLITETSRMLRRVMGTARRDAWFRVCGWACSQGIINYVVAPFVLLSFNESIELWSEFAFIGHWMLAVIYVVCLAIQRTAERRSEVRDVAPIVHVAEAKHSDMLDNANLLTNRQPHSKSEIAPTH